MCDCCALLCVYRSVNGCAEGEEWMYEWVNEQLTNSSIIVNDSPVTTDKELMRILVNM